MANELSKTGARRLAHFEEVIDKGLGTFQAVGEALISIRDEKLYRAEHDTFDTYCRRRWGFTDRRARQLMTAAEIGTMVPIENERQARALEPIKDDPEAMRAAVDAATAATNGAPTAAAIKAEVVKRKDEHMAEAHPALDVIVRFNKTRKAWFAGAADVDPAELVDAYVAEGQCERVHDFVTSLRSFADRMEARLREATKLKGVK